MKIELTEEQANTILFVLIKKLDYDIECLANNPESKYYLEEVVKTKKIKDCILKSMKFGGNEK